MQGKQHVRTPFGRIYEWLDMAEHFTFSDEEVRWMQITANVMRLGGVPPLQGLKVCNMPPFACRLLPFHFTALQKQKKFATFDFAAMRAEVQAVEKAATAVCSPVVFAHNDLLSGEP